MNWTKEQKKKEEKKIREIEETGLNLQKKIFNDLGIDIL